MLGVRELGLKSKSQSSIRHQVRKLRAKVKALIPEQMCQHFEKRNHQVQKINYRQAQYAILSKQEHNLATQPGDRGSCNSGWKYGREKLEEYHVSTEPKSCILDHKKYQFDKLKPDEIEQINEDKFYYLGEKNVDAYNNYLKSLKSKKYADSETKHDTKSIKQSQLKFSRDSVMLRKVESVSLWDLSKNKISRSSRLPKSNLNQSTLIKYNKMSLFSSNYDKKNQEYRSSMTTIPKFRSEGQIRPRIKRQSVNPTLQSDKKDCKVEIKKSFQQRKQQKDQDQRQKRIYQKLKIETQLAKAEQNQRQNRYRLFSKIKQLRNQQKQRQENALKKKSILMKKGQIVKFNEELRDIMIRRKNMDSVRSQSNTIEFDEPYRTQQ